MEIKIKDKDQLIDATIEVVDGVMIVSPKEIPFEPKNGDVIHCTNSRCSYISIFKWMHPSDKDYYYHATLIDNGSFKIGSKISDFSDYANPRYATEEEKQKLFDKLKEEGYEWDANKKELVKVKWKPKYNEEYWCPSWLYSDGIIPYFAQWSNSKADNIYQNKGWVFRTKEECEQFCSKLNNVIEGVKP
jgi:hypothetical protein